MKTPRWDILAGTGFLLVAICATVARAQQPPPPPPPPEQTTPPAESTGSSSSDKSKNHKYSHANDFLIIGTVFDPKGYAFPGVELRVRRSSEKRFRWDSYTNSRGEFAIRVPQGTAYEMIVHAKGFADQTRNMDAKSGLSEARMVFRLEPAVKDEKK